ncbi:hypothetical protein LUZ60_015769 [Juncus effusus]|nr:hypothetical protein LUZ60_015769 [Juncus effusus]
MALLLSPSSASFSFSDHRRSTVRRLDTISTMSELRQYHSQIIRLNLSSDNDAVGRLLKFAALSDSGDLSYALKLFYFLPNPDAFIFNTLFRALSSHPDPPVLPCDIFLQMLENSVFPNHFTFPPLLRSVSSSKFLPFGRQLHSLLHKLGFSSDSFARNNLLYMYLSCDCPSDAWRVFHTTKNRDVVAWTTMISGLSKLGLVDKARELFDEMPDRNSVSWNAMIAGYVQDGFFNEAMEVFDEMLSEGILVNKFVAASMLSACTGLGALEKGEWIHKQIPQREIELDSKLATTIIDMYCKCGSLEKSFEVFNGLSRKSLSTWNCMIGGFAIHGKGEKSIEIFKRMEMEGPVPDDITFLNLLSACAHSGLVSEGQHYFDYMVQNYYITPKMTHYGCMVDLLGRAGLIKEAKWVVDSMPMEPDVGVLGALLGACKIHGIVDLGQEIGERLLELDYLNSGRYVLLANLYAGAGRMDDVAEIRRLMNDRGVKKEAGRSVIEMNGNLNEFICNGTSHPESKAIYSMLYKMTERVKEEGYKYKSEVLHEINEDSLDYHSEKLAIAFGLIHSKKGEILRITKNLRVCKDCHEVSKIVSKVFEREIVVRDRNRFHHFRDGVCSCNDYW